MSAYLDKRRSETTSRLNALRGKLGEAEVIAKGRACVYVIGSFGRGEASSHSDLDVFIAGRPLDPPPEQEKCLPELNRLKQICVKAKLIESTKEMGIPEFSDDGEYLEHYTVAQLIKTLGHPDDDASNTFTARLLLLLESKPLLVDDVYWEAIGRVIDAYWRDFEGHKSDFVPGFLANDILRIWRTFCVNYEARTSSEPEQKKARRKLKNYKLKHSRLLTCYSAVAYLLAVFAARKTVTPADVKGMVKLSPTERLDALVDEFGSNKDTVRKLLDAYEEFLRNTDASKDELVERFMEPAVSRQYFDEANKFGDLVCDLLDAIGRGTRLHRLLMI